MIDPNHGDRGRDRGVNQPRLTGSGGAARSRASTGRSPAATDGGNLRAASDEELVATYVEGDQRAFEHLVARHERRVYAICYRYFGNAADAEDAAQEAFVALLRRARTFSGASSFSTWMYRVATNACNDLARKRARRPQRSDTDVSEMVERLAPAGPGLDEELESRELPPELVRALRELDAGTREAVVLHDVYGYAYHEIAARSDVAVGTVKSRIHRGHAKLAQALLDATPGGQAEPSQPPKPPIESP